MSHKMFTFDNGLTVVCHFLPEAKSVAVGVWFQAGSRFETYEENGISHFLEHMLFKGTENRSCLQLKQEIEGVGGSFNAFTSEELTCYWIKILSRYLERSLDVLSDMILHPLLQEEDMKKEKIVIAEELHLLHDQPAQYVHELFQKALFSPHPLGQPVLGSEKTVFRFTKNDLLCYLKKFYTATNSVISISGNLPTGSLKNLVKRFWGRWTAGKKNQFPSWPGDFSGPRIKIQNRDTQQVNFCLGGPAVSVFSEKKYAFALLNTILGGNTISRLFESVREKLGLSYDIRSYVKHYQDTGAFVISGGTSPDKIETTLDVIVREMRMLRDKGLKPGELSRAREFLTGQILMALEESLEDMLWIGEQQIIQGRILTPEDVIKKINEVKTEEVLGLARTFFQPAKLCLVMVGPVAKKERLHRILAKL